MMVSSRRTLFEYEDTHSLRPIQSHFIQRGETWCLFSPDSVLSLDAEQEARSEILDVFDTKTVSLLDILHEVTWKDYLYNHTNCQMGLIVITFDRDQWQPRKINEVSICILRYLGCSVISESWSCDNTPGMQIIGFITSLGQSRSLFVKSLIS